MFTFKWPNKQTYNLFVLAYKKKKTRCT
uniref:Uncharacterized protein n=2 Tax=Anguilla anguilla TaxID=7936 RepID=A0A0E9RHE8_ANGAN